ncbi:MAG: hypothetical protein KAW56_07080 [Candidatus Marinimicrobia bacterium]|nr:hypothetical protein [Candidatus Neomarinimicrobiota bacterium]
MKTKEAIEFIKKHNKPKHFYTWERKKFKDIIELLQRGEKFEAIEKEIEYNLDWHRPECPFTTPDTELIDEILQMIEGIKQKYFPKPSKDFTEKVMEKINNEGEK